jgi:hypothetical protein
VRGVSLQGLERGEGLGWGDGLLLGMSGSPAQLRIGDDGKRLVGGDGSVRADAQGHSGITKVPAPPCPVRTFGAQADRPVVAVVRERIVRAMRWLHAGHHSRVPEAFHQLVRYGFDVLDPMHGPA